MRPVPLLLLCAVAAVTASATPLWPGGDVRLEAREGAAIEERGGTVYVQTERRRPGTYPNVAFMFRHPTDLSTARDNARFGVSNVEIVEAIRTLYPRRFGPPASP